MMNKSLYRILLSGILTLFLFNANSLIAQDTSWVSILKLKPDTASNKRLLSNVYDLVNAGKYITAQKRLFSIRKRIQKVNDDFQSGRFYNVIGLTYDFLGNIDSAKFNYFIAIKYFKKCNNDSRIASVYLNMSAMYMIYHNQVSSLTYSLKALSYAEKAKDSNAVAGAKSNIGGIYFQQRDYSKAKKYFIEGWILAKRKGLTTFEGNSSYNLGAIYFIQANADSAILMYSNAIRIYRSSGDSLSVADCMLGMAPAYRLKKQYKTALNLYEKALGYKRKAEYFNNQEVYVNMAILYSYLKDYKKALSFLDTALAKYTAQKDNKGIASVYKARSETEFLIGDFRSAYLSRVKFGLYTDSVYNANVLNELSDLKTQYEVEKKETQLKSEQAIERAAMNARAEEERIRNWYVIISILIVLVVIIVFSVLLLRRFRVSQRQNKIIAMQKQQVEHQKYLVEEKQKEILDSIHYARRIQQAQLPSEKYLSKILKKGEN